MNAANCVWKNDDVTKSLVPVMLPKKSSLLFQRYYNYLSVLVGASLYVEPYGAVVAVLDFHAHYVVFVKGMFCDLMNRQSIPKC